MAIPKPKQARLDSFFSLRGQDMQPSTTSIKPMPTEETPITPTVSTNTSIYRQQQTYEMGITNDLGIVFEHHSQLTDAERYRLLTSNDPKNDVLLDTVRHSHCKFLKAWLEDDRFSSWLVYTQLSGGGGLCKICIVMQAHLKHGNIGNAAFVKKPYIDFKKFIEKAVDHRDVGYHKEATTAAKNFVKSMESGQNVCASLETAYATQMRENRNIITFIVKTVIFCASNNIPLHDHSEDEGNFMKLLQFRIDAEDEELKKHFARMTGNTKYTSLMFQNEILATASNMIVQEIVTEANKSFVSVIADE